MAARRAGRDTRRDGAAVDPPRVACLPQPGILDTRNAAVVALFALPRLRRALLSLPDSEVPLLSPSSGDLPEGVAAGSPAALAVALKGVFAAMEAYRAEASTAPGRARIVARAGAAERGEAPWVVSDRLLRVAVEWSPAAPVGAAEALDRLLTPLSEWCSRNGHPEVVEALDAGERTTVVPQDRARWPSLCKSIGPHMALVTRLEPFRMGCETLETRLAARSDAHSIEYAWEVDGRSLNLLSFLTHTPCRAPAHLIIDTARTMFDFNTMQAMANHTWMPFPRRLRWGAFLRSDARARAAAAHDAAGAGAAEREAGGDDRTKPSLAAAAEAAAAAAGAGDGDGDGDGDLDYELTAIAVHHGPAASAGGGNTHLLVRTGAGTADESWSRVDTASCSRGGVSPLSIPEACFGGCTYAADGERRRKARSAAILYYSRVFDEEP